MKSKQRQILDWSQFSPTFVLRHLVASMKSKHGQILDWNVTLNSFQLPEWRYSEFRVQVCTSCFMNTVIIIYKCFCSDLVPVITSLSSSLVFNIFRATFGDTGIYVCAANTAFTLPQDIPVFIRANVTVIGESCAHTRFSIKYLVVIRYLSKKGCEFVTILRDYFV